MNREIETFKLRHVLFIQQMSEVQKSEISGWNQRSNVRVVNRDTALMNTDLKVLRSVENGEIGRVQSAFS